MELQEVADMIQKGEYQEQVSEFRSMYPLMTYATRSKDGTLDGYEGWPKNLPRICFALERITKGYTGLVLLEVNNLTGSDEAEAVRRGAGEMPQTLMAFVGADGQSVKIVCQGELFPGGNSSRCWSCSATSSTQTEKWPLPVFITASMTNTVFHHPKLTLAFKETCSTGPIYLKS